MLSFMAEHRLVLESQVAALLDCPRASVQRRLHTLAASRYVARWQVAEAPCCRIEARGLRAMGSALRPPRENLGAYRHDVGVAWLWLAAHRGQFGPVADVVGERRMRSHDMVGPEEPYSIRLGGYEVTGRPRRHYPDVILIDHHGRRLALELELTHKEKPRLEAILAGYGVDRRVDGVVYVVQENPDGQRIARSVWAAAQRLGIAERVHVTRMTPRDAGDGQAERTAHVGRSAREVVQ